jgi:hypothetical protein
VTGVALRIEAPLDGDFALVVDALGWRQALPARVAMR